MIDLIVGLFILLLTTPKEETYRPTENNDEMLRPLLMEDFHDDYNDYTS